MNTRRRLTGVVISNSMEKTVIVEVTRTYQHRLYKKVVNSRKRYMTHDELGCQIGDHVRIVESQPISRRKRWIVEEILRRDIGAGVPEFEDTVAENVEAEV
ncbi:MAG: 30S ribosomal protein S17 [Anaerolineales bacterium]|nr:MAG: 30S ribosomal protein S17 [Anaerolineales bacterium]